jgi:hypothetical protein
MPLSDDDLAFRSEALRRIQAATMMTVVTRGQRNAVVQALLLRAAGLMVDGDSDKLVEDVLDLASVGLDAMREWVRKEELQTEGIAE